jgi:two-component system, NtrC family, response regulator HydG
MSERVLIVDDDKDHAESIADLLQLRGFEVAVAYSGEQALQLFQRPRSTSRSWT